MKDSNSTPDKKILKEVLSDYITSDEEFDKIYKMSSDFIERRERYDSYNKDSKAKNEALSRAIDLEQTNASKLADSLPDSDPSKEFLNYSVEQVSQIAFSFYQKFISENLSPSEAKEKAINECSVWFWNDPERQNSLINSFDNKIVK